MSERQQQQKITRREQILQALAQMLEGNPGGRITTAALARQVGVSEAALYRHFPSKARMFEGLIGFIEETLFSRVNLIVGSDASGARQCEQILTLLLAFVEKNPGMARILTRRCSQWRNRAPAHPCQSAVRAAGNPAQADHARGGGTLRPAHGDPRRLRRQPDSGQRRGSYPSVCALRVQAPSHRTLAGTVGASGPGTVPDLTPSTCAADSVRCTGPPQRCIPPPAQTPLSPLQCASA